LKPSLFSLYVVTDPEYLGTRRLLDVCAQAVQAGVRVVQLRNKQASTRERVEQGRALKAWIGPLGAYVLINDRVDVALAVRADGVHLGQDDLSLDDARRLMGPDAIIGVSVRTSEEMQAAEQGGASYLAASGVFDTPTKTDVGTPIGLEGLGRLRKATSKPLVAIGGINSTNAADVVAAGADGVAVVSAVMAAPDVGAACREILREVAFGRRTRG
jgi:thiamine-phosphate pyrophosphorylase